MVRHRFPACHGKTTERGGARVRACGDSSESIWRRVAASRETGGVRRSGARSVEDVGSAGTDGQDSSRLFRSRFAHAAIRDDRRRRKTARVDGSGRDCRCIRARSGDCRIVAPCDPPRRAATFDSPRSRDDVRFPQRATRARRPGTRRARPRVRLSRRRNRNLFSRPVRLSARAARTGSCGT